MLAILVPEVFMGMLQSVTDLILCITKTTREVELKKVVTVILCIWWSSMSILLKSFGHGLYLLVYELGLFYHLFCHCSLDIVKMYFSCVLGVVIV